MTTKPRHIATTACTWVLLALTALLAALAISACSPTSASSSSAASQAASSSAASSSAQAQSDASSSSAPAQATSQTPSTSSAPAQPSYYSPGEGYTLQQVVVLSRHNIRAPLSTNGSALAQATTHKWIDWTANPSELTLRGGALETMMGQYFRTWLETEGLIPQNWQPTDAEARFYANAKQRTIATAQYFSSGMLPVANTRIETHAPYDTMDPVFTPGLSFVSDSYQEAALQQIAEWGGANGMAGVAAELEDNFKLLADVVDYENSEGVGSGELAPFDTTDTQVVLELGKEPGMSGSLKTACSLADALVLQYYEAADDARAAFGKNLSLDEWTAISKIKDLYGDVLFTAPLVATNVAHPLLEEIAAELDAHESGRLFTFLCGHDSNLGSVLAALEASAYELPDTIEKKTPIGSKLLFERWTDSSGAELCRVRLLYQSTEQLKGLTLLADGEEPMSYEISFEGLQKNADGLYAFSEVRDRLQEAIEGYDQLLEDYGEPGLAQAA